VPADAAPWLFGVARKVIAGQLRSDAWRAALCLRLEAAGGGPAGPGDIGEEITQRDVVLAALARLNENDREALRLIAWYRLRAVASAFRQVSPVVAGVSDSKELPTRQAAGTGTPATSAGRPDPRLP
jgi:hypothetical protein